MAASPTAAADLSVGSVASFGTFRASLPRPHARTRSSHAPPAARALAESKESQGLYGSSGDEDVSVDGVEAVDASVLWQRRFQRDEAIDVVEIGDESVHVGAIAGLSDAELLDLLRRK